MTLTQERANVLTEFLNADEERTKDLFALEANEAQVQINALGNDFTLDEIIEYGEAVKKLTAQGELDADALDNVAGGFLTTSMLFSAGMALGGAAVSRVW